jgi:hypothetical protein
MKALGLTGTGTRDSLTINLEAGQSVTLNRTDIPKWPQGPALKKSTVVIDGTVFLVSYGVQIMQVAADYFSMVAGAT